MKKANLKLLALSSMALAIGVQSQGANAHTTVFASVPAFLGYNSLNYLQISHGCLDEKTGARLPIIAESVALPNNAPTILFKDVATGTITPGNLSDFTATDHTGAISGLENVGDVIRPVLPQAGWKSTKIIYDDTIPSRVIGWTNNGGNFQLPGTSAYTEQPFRVSTINAKADSCARSLQVKIAIADVCKLNKWPVTKENAAADLWIPNTTAKFPYGNVDAVGTPVDANDPSKGSKPLTGFPATLTLWRDQGGTNPGAAPGTAKANKLPEACGKGYDVIMYPSNLDVDTVLPKVWPGKK